jgi:hypothetical protein
MEITPAIVTEFRAYFGGRYSNSTIWSDALMYDVLYNADFETGGTGWGPYDTGVPYSLKKHGMFLYAAAYLSSMYGDDPAQPIDPNARLNVAGKSVGDESIQYRVASMMDAGNDFLTYTTFGQEFYRLRKRAYLGARAV